MAQKRLPTFLFLLTKLRQLRIFDFFYYQPFKKIVTKTLVAKIYNLFIWLKPPFSFSLLCGFLAKAILNKQKR